MTDKAEHDHLPFCDPRVLSTLERASRASVLGVIASGIAHELNQPLATIMNCAEIALLKLGSAPPDPAALRGLLEGIVSQTERAADMIRHLRRSLKDTDPHWAPFDLHDCIHTVARLAHPELVRRGYRLRLEFSPEPHRIEGDVVQIEQVLLNLVRNGIESMELQGVGRGELTIRTRLDGPRTVEVAVSDTGCGIPSEYQAKVFTAFFSTKPQCLGLGLSFCRSILAAHGGRIWFTPNEGTGVTFRFDLPLYWEGAA